MDHGVHQVVAPTLESRVAAVLLNWNGWIDTLACLDALEGLTVPVQVLVVDNGSTDGSVQLIRAARPNVSIRPLPRNIGFGPGVNEGIRAIVGESAAPEFVWVLNNDAVPSPDSLQYMLAVADADPRVGMVGSVLLEADGTDRVQAWGGGQVNRWLGTTTTYRTSVPSDPDHLVGASMLIRAAVLETVGGFDERYFFYLEDTDLSCRATDAGWRLAVADNATVVHHRGASVDRGQVDRHSVRSDAHYASSTAVFLTSWAPRLLLPLLAFVRLSSIVVRRLQRRQFGRIPVVVRAFMGGVRIGLSAPVIPTFRMNLGTHSAPAPHARGEIAS